jgi:hypothetical protein
MDDVMVLQDPLTIPAEDPASSRIKVAVSREISMVVSFRIVATNGSALRCAMRWNSASTASSHLTLVALLETDDVRVLLNVAVS